MIHYEVTVTPRNRRLLRAKTNEPNLVRQNLRLVKKLYPDLAQGDLRRLRELTHAHLLSVSQGEILCIDENGT